MGPILLTLYGDLAIRSYGFFMALGIITGIYLFLKDPKTKFLIKENDFFQFLYFCIITGLLGARSLYALENWSSIGSWWQFFKLWEGGLSVQGSIIALLITTPLFLNRKHIKPLRLFDRMSVYLPLVQSIARLGCLYAGCCHGLPTDSIISISYTDPASLAPLHIALYPTQLYSSGLLFMAFLILYFYAQHNYTKLGQLSGMYLILISIERFSIDFLRWEVEYTNFSSLFSYQQIIACAIALVGCILFFNHYLRKKAHGFV